MRSRLPADVQAAVGNEATDASRGWFVPREPSEGDYSFEAVEGAPFDGTGLAVVEDVPRAPSTPVEPVAFSSDLPEQYQERARHVADALVKLAPERGRRDGMMALAGAACSIIEPAHVPAFVMAVRQLAGWETSPGKLRDAQDTVENKRAGRHVTGFERLRETGWGAVSEALERTPPAVRGSHGV